MSSSTPSNSVPATSSAASRIASLDQFRGYTVLGMFFVNFMSRFSATPSVFLHHHTYFSYADTIMPQFFFAVGVSYRLTFMRSMAKAGPVATYRKFLKRNFGLILLGIIVYLRGDALPWSQFENSSLDVIFGKRFLRPVFQTLVHIGVTAIWIMPVIAAGPIMRILYGACGVGLHFLLSYSFYFGWVLTGPVGIDGGVLGFLTWAVPMLAGTLACDVLLSKPRQAPIRFMGWGLVLMALGYGLSCLVLQPPTLPAGVTRHFEPGITFRVAEPPFIRPASEMLDEHKNAVSVFQCSQRAGTPTYLILGAGFSLLVYSLFVLLCDIWPGLGLGILRTLGNNALAAYLIHDMVGDALQMFCPKDAPMWYGMMMFGIFVGICYIFLRYLEKRGMFLRL